MIPVKKRQEKLSGRELSELMMLEEELRRTKKEYGIEERKSWIEKLLDLYHSVADRRGQRLVSKKKYLWLCLLTGFAGGHRFYTHQFITALIYLVTSWTGFGLAMTLLDVMAVVPMKPDGDGNILI